MADKDKSNDTPVPEQEAVLADAVKEENITSKEINQENQAESAVLEQAEAAKQSNWRQELEGQINSLQGELQKVKNEAAAYYDRWLRLAADFENYKKRTGREMNSLVKNANENLIAQLVPILDNLERALQASKEASSGGVESLRQGIKMIYDLFFDILKRQGLNPIPATGEPFDPTKHDALMTVETDQYLPNHVAAEIEKGYMLNDKVIRPAKVAVAQSRESRDGEADTRQKDDQAPADGTISPSVQ